MTVAGLSADSQRTSGREAAQTEGSSEESDAFVDFQRCNGVCCSAAP